ESRANRNERFGYRYADRYLLARRPALRIADRQDSFRCEAIAGIRARPISPNYSRAGTTPAFDAPEHDASGRVDYNRESAPHPAGQAHPPVAWRSGLDR